MQKRLCFFVVFVLVVGSVACTGRLEPTATVRVTPGGSPQLTATPVSAEISIAGPACPKAFRDHPQRQMDVEINAGGLLTLTLGSTPSLPCRWHTPENSDPIVVRQVDHQTVWPAEDMTPVPGAPGSEIWIFETLQVGGSSLSFKCVCLGEEGVAEEARGMFTLNVAIRD